MINDALEEQTNSNTRLLYLLILLDPKSEIKKKKKHWLMKA